MKHSFEAEPLLMNLLVLYADYKIIIVLLKESLEILVMMTEIGITLSHFSIYNRNTEIIKKLLSEIAKFMLNLISFREIS